MVALTKSPFFRPLCVAAAFLLIFAIRTPMRGDTVTISKLMMIGGWTLLSAALAGFAQIIAKKEFGWNVAFVTVVLGAMAIALLMLGLQRLGLVYQ
jgi:hypothetical protein